MTTPKPKPTAHYRSGFCNAGNPLDSHDRCPGAYKGTACECDQPGCPCANSNAAHAAIVNDALQGATLCGPDEPTDADLQVVAQFADALRIPDERARHAALTALSQDDAATVRAIGGEPATVQQHHATATVDGTPVEVTVTGERWTWEADAAAELMLEPGDCPMCEGAWDAHLFLDDGRVACA